jgi:hypothetical protein
MNSPIFLFTGLVILASAVVMVVSLLQLARLRDEPPSRPRRQHRSRFSLRRLRSRASESLRRHAEPSAWTMSRDLTE